MLLAERESNVGAPITATEKVGCGRSMDAGDGKGEFEALGHVPSTYVRCSASAASRATGATLVSVRRGIAQIGSRQHGARHDDLDVDLGELSEVLSARGLGGDSVGRDVEPFSKGSS